MDYHLSLLYDMYAEAICQAYKDSDKKISYQYQYSYYSSYETVEVSLCQCTSSQLRCMLETKVIILSELPLTLNKKQQQLYNAFINIARFNYHLACDFVEQRLYLTEKDKKILKTSIINNFNGHIQLFKRQSLIEYLQLTDEEWNRLLLYAINEYDYISVIIQYYDKLTNFHKNIILQNLLISERATDCLLNTNIPLEFRLQVFQYIYKDNYDLYYDLFMRYYNNEIHDVIRDTLFKYVYQHYDNFSIWSDHLYKLNENELELICKKFYDQIFDTKSFNAFYSQCLRFNKWLRKPERLTLIQKLKAKTRASKIAYAKTHIPWEPDELDILNSIDLRNKLI